MASATILVVEAGKTKSSQAAGTIDALRDVGANVIGVVLNKASRRVGAGYYFQYGQRPYGQLTAGHDNEASSDDLFAAEDPAPEPDRHREAVAP